MHIKIEYHSYNIENVSAYQHTTITAWSNCKWKFRYDMVILWVMSFKLLVSMYSERNFFFRPKSNAHCILQFEACFCPENHYFWNFWTAERNQRINYHHQAKWNHTMIHYHFSNEWKKEEDGRLGTQLSYFLKEVVYFTTSRILAT